MANVPLTTSIPVTLSGSGYVHGVYSGTYTTMSLYKNKFANVYQTSLPGFLSYCSDKEWVHGFLNQIMTYYSEPLVHFCKIGIHPLKFQKLTDIVMSVSMPLELLQDFMQFLDYINVVIDPVLYPDINNGYLVISDSDSIPAMGMPIGLGGTITITSGPIANWSITSSNNITLTPGTGGK